MSKAQIACTIFAAAMLTACSPQPAPEAPAEPEAVAEAPACPPVDVTSTAPTPPSRVVTFAVALENAPPDVTYNWTISAGAITGGQGAASITAEPPPAEDTTVTVEVRGNFAPDCQTRYGSATVLVP